MTGGEIKRAVLKKKMPVGKRKNIVLSTRNGGGGRWGRERESKRRASEYGGDPGTRNGTDEN